MPPEFKELESKLDRSAPAVLSLHERERVWKGVEGRIAPQKHISSPYVFSLIKIKHTSMITIAIALVVLLGASGTVAASDSARPGDLLFPVDRMAEEAHIAFTTNADAKAELRARFAEERMQEFEEIVAEEKARGEATGSTTISAEGEARVEHALSVLEGFLVDADVRASSTAHARAVLEGLETRSDAVIRTLPEGLKLRLKDMLDTGTTSDEQSGRVDAEADILPTHTNVKVNVDGHPVNFTTSATTRADIVSEISEKLDIDADAVESVLEINGSTSAETNVDVNGSLGL